MTTEPREDNFFVGYINALPRPLRGFLLVVAGGLIAGFAGAALGIAASQDNPGTGRFQSGLGKQQITGVLQAEPYPIIRALPSEDFPEGHTWLLSGLGKRGVQDAAAKLDGALVDVEGVIIRRGKVDMLRVNRKPGLQESKATPSERETALVRSLPIPLGRWRLAGEICDGKCYVGAMRPGRGLAHKACANFCLAGGVPPVFVTPGRVKGYQFFLLADQNGKPLTDRILDLVGIYIQAEGEIEQIGDLMVFKIDLASVEVL